MDQVSTEQLEEAMARLGRAARDGDAAAIRLTHVMLDELVRRGARHANGCVRVGA